VTLGGAVIVCFFSSRRRHTRFSRDWSSDVCSSDLVDESALFSPGMQRPLPDAFGAGMPQPAEEDAATLVARFDAALAAWPAQQAELAAAAEGLYARAGNAEGARRMYRVEIGRAHV